MSRRNASRQYCSIARTPELVLSPDVHGARARAIITTREKWANGTVLHYYFFDRDTDGAHVWVGGQREWRSWVGGKRQTDVVRGAFEDWKNVGIGLEFQEVPSRHDAEIRIGFMQGDGSWSYLGRQILGQGANARTMNFGWNIDGDRDTAIHEIGHTLGLPHEHQNPFAGIVWDEEEVYAALAKPPNEWDRDTTFYNIIRKIRSDEVQGSNWDPDSIMHYAFEAGLIEKPEEYQEGLEPAEGLSERDRSWVQSFYPTLDPAEQVALVPFQSVPLAVGAGQQRDLSIQPEATRDYTIRTFGSSDTVVVLFEEDGGEPRYVAGDDDSGEDRNAQLEVRLVKDHRYILRIRLYYSGESGETAVMFW